MAVKPEVAVIMGSDSDLPVMKETVSLLEEFGIPCEVKILSAHRSPGMTCDYARECGARGIKVIIAAAGGAAHLAGVIAAHTIVPVVGVPLESGSLKGVDSLFSTVQMPAGVPVATMAIGRSGARNAALFAARILGVENGKMRKRLDAYRKKLLRSVKEKNKAVPRRRSKISAKRKRRA